MVRVSARSASVPNSVPGMITAEAWAASTRSRCSSCSAVPERSVIRRSSQALAQRVAQVLRERGGHLPREHDDVHLAAAVEPAQHPPHARTAEEQLPHHRLGAVRPPQHDDVVVARDRGEPLLQVLHAGVQPLRHHRHQRPQEDHVAQHRQQGGDDPVDRPHVVAQVPGVGEPEEGPPHAVPQVAGPRAERIHATPPSSEMSPIAAAITSSRYPAPRTICRSRRNFSSSYARMGCRGTGEAGERGRPQPCVAAPARARAPGLSGLRPGDV
jgi:hypothetical protein